MEKKQLIGCIADDFTGAADVCSFLVESGASCVLVNDIPKHIPKLEVEVVVIALKIRTVSKEKALSKVKDAIDFFEKIGVTKIYDKYCSTFDSTSEGNIGPVLDYLIDRYNQKYSIISPALPDNNREVFNGYLFADGVLLNEGSMANHPLTPMKDAKLSRLMDAQSKYKSYSLNYKIIEKGKDSINFFVNNIDKDNKFYIISDYFKNIHGENIIESFGNLKILSGSSVLIRDWYKYLFKNKENKKVEIYEKNSGKSILFSGSLSNQTQKQIKNFIDNNGYAIEVKAKYINEEYIKKIKNIILNSNENILFFSTRDENISTEELKINANKLEEFFSKIAVFAYENDIKKIVVAGGETSGAIIKSLPFEFYKSTALVDSGVPVLRPLENTKFQIILKSGNFGQEDFFNRSIEIMES